MTQQLSAEDAGRDAVEQAEQACQAAVEATPDSYRGFLVFIRQYKRVAGTRANPVWAPIRLPYMSVNGRVKMARDAHKEQGASLVIQTRFDVEPTSGQLLCQATVTSTLLGTATAHARAFLSGEGVDATNPLENAETSAIGRALGFLGYGLYGTGIASAEEVVQATAERDTQRAQGDAPAPDSPAPDAPGPEGRSPSDRQRTFLRGLLEQTGTSEEDIEARLATIATSQEASARIDQLRAQLREQAA